MVQGNFNGSYGGGGSGLGSADIIFGQAPSESPNGSRVLFTLPDAYVANKLTVYRNNEPLKTGEVTETNPNAGTFTLSVAPDTDETIQCDYIKQ